MFKMGQRHEVFFTAPIFPLCVGDVLAQALDNLNDELKCEESRGLYIHYGGVHALLPVLWSSRAGLHRSIDILMKLTEQSRK